VIATPGQRPGRVAGLYAERVARGGLLGLLPSDPLGEAWASVAHDQWAIKIVSHPSPDAAWRGRQLTALLATLVARHGAAAEALHAGSVVRPGVTETQEKEATLFPRPRLGKEARLRRVARLDAPIPFTHLHEL
jgi:hypothetical protein